MKFPFVISAVFAVPFVGFAFSWPTVKPIHWGESVAVAKPASPYGICAHLDNPGTLRGPNTSWHRSDETARMMYDAGIRCVRTDLAWGACETAEGVWDYTRTDRAIDMCVKRGIEPIPILAFSVPWANPAHEHPEKWWRYVRNVVGRYKDRVRVWEVWNEENCGFWKPVPDAHVYGRFLKLTYETVKAVDPTAKVALGGTTGVDFGFIGTIQKDGMNRYYDILCVHPYFDPYDPEHRVDTWLRRLRAQMDAAGDAGKPIWITEMGMPTAPNPSARNTGNIAAGLAAVGRAEKPLRVLYWHGGRDGKVIRDDDPFLYMYRRDFPKGSVFEVVGLESFPAALAKGGYDAIVMGGAERYPGKAQHPIADFVRNGGLLVCVGGAALWYPERVEDDGGVKIDSCEKYNSWWLRNCILRFEMDVWFLNKKIPQRPNDDYLSKPTEALWKFRPNEQSCARFFRPNGLKEGDRWIPLLRCDMGNGYVADGVVAIKYGSDLKGAVVLSGVTEPQGCRVCSPARQARVLARAYLLALACGVERACWYELIAHGNDPSDSEEHFGIVNKDLSPKPAYAALKALAARRPAGSTVCGDLNGFDRAVYSPQWKLPDGSSAGALWSVDRPGTYAVKFRGDGRVELADVFGRVSPAEMRNGVVELELGDSPVYYRGAEIEQVTLMK